MNFTNMYSVLFSSVSRGKEGKNNSESLGTNLQQLYLLFYVEDKEEKDVDYSGESVRQAAYHQFDEVLFRVCFAVGREWSPSQDPPQYP